MEVINPKKMKLDEWIDKFRCRRDELKFELKKRLDEHEPLFKRYYLGKRIGSGGFGTVFELKQNEVVKPSSVVKIILIPDDKEAEEIYNTGCNDGNMNEKLNEIVCRVSNEVKLLEQFRGHENIVAIMDSDKIKISGTFFAILIQMEYLTPMTHFFNSRGYLNEKNVIMLGIDICSAIEELNKSNVLHRDVKPENIFVNNNGIFQLGDFGIARYIEETTDVTRIGTHGYIAPEVFYGIGVGTNNKVDMYALGLVLYQLLNLNDLPKNKMSVLPPRDGSPSLKKIVLKACAFKPEDRFVDIKQMKKELISIFNN